MTYNNQNIFAKILRGDAPCVKLAEDKHTLAFMDIMPQSEGHCLVIPKIPAEDIFSLPPDKAGSLIRQTQKIAKAVQHATRCDGVVIAQLNGEAAGQTVFHIHFHIIPRYGDNKPFIMHGQPIAKPEKLEAIAKKIRAALAKL